MPESVLPAVCDSKLLTARALTSPTFNGVRRSQASRNHEGPQFERDLEALSGLKTQLSISRPDQLRRTGRRRKPRQSSEGNL